MSPGSIQKFPRGVEVVGSAIIESRAGKILLTRAPKWSNKWTMPGGHIEPGERVEAALLREAAEEVGLDLTPEAIIDFGELIGPKDFARPAHFIYFDVLCRAQSTHVTLDKAELSAYRWVMPTKALTMDLAESYAKTITRYIAYRRDHPAVSH